MQYVDIQTRRRRSHRLSWSLLACLVVVTNGCSFQDFDYLKKGEASSAKGGKGGNSSQGGDTASDGGSTASTTATDSAGTAGVTATGGGMAGAPATEGGSSGAATGGAATGGTTAEAPMIGPWTFDTAAQMSDWNVKIAATISASWVEQGESDPKGSMALTLSAAADPDQVGVQTEVEYLVPSSKRDLSARRLFYRVRTETGAVTVKTYVMSEGWTWADGGITTVGTTWTTVGVIFGSPSFAGTSDYGDYDPTKIMAIGIQPCLNADPTVDTQVTLWVDRIWVE